MERLRSVKKKDVGQGGFRALYGWYSGRGRQVERLRCGKHNGAEERDFIALCDEHSECALPRSHYSSSASVCC
jgi:hypothetical protein